MQNWRRRDLVEGFEVDDWFVGQCFDWISDLFV